MRDAKLAQRLHHRLHAVMVGCHGEHAERLPSEMLLVLFPGMGGEIGAHFALEARLQKIGAGDGHRAAVDLDHKGMAGAVRELKSEDEVRDDADFVHFSLVRELHAQRQRIARGASLLRESGDDVVGMDELHVASSTGGDLQRDREIDDLQLMLDKRAAGLRKQIGERLVGALLEGFRRVAREQIERLPGTIGELYSFCGHGLTFGGARRRVDITDNRSYISPTDD